MLCLASFLFTMELVVFSMIKISRNRITGVKNRKTAKSLATVGIHWAESMLDNGKWKPNEISPAPGKVKGDLLKFRGLVCLKESLESPILVKPGGYFRVDMFSYEDRFYRINSTGIIGKQSYCITREFPENFPPGEEGVPGSITEPLDQTVPIDIKNPEIPASPENTPVIEETIEIKPGGSHTPEVIYTPSTPGGDVEHPPLPEIY